MTVALGLIWPERAREMGEKPSQYFLLIYFNVML